MHELLAARLAAKGDTVLRVKVIPKSAKTEITGELADGTLKVKVAAAPERGKANDALCVYLAREIGVRQSNVEVVSGRTSSMKSVRVRR